MGFCKSIASINKSRVDIAVLFRAAIFFGFVKASDVIKTTHPLIAGRLFKDFLQIK